MCELDYGGIRKKYYRRNRRKYFLPLPSLEHNSGQRDRRTNSGDRREEKMQPAPATPGSPTRSSCCERDREREVHEDRGRERNNTGRQSRMTPEEDHEERGNERTVISGQNLGAMTVSGNQGLPLSLSLEDRDLWTKFQCLTNEMIVTKNGR